MIRLMDRDGTRFGGTGADAVGSLALLAPLRADDQTCLDEHALQSWIDLLAQDDTGGIRQQQRVARAGNLLIERVHFRARDLHQLFVLGLQILDPGLIDHRGLIVHGGIEIEVVQATAPRSADRRRQRGGRRRLLCRNRQRE